VRGDHGRAGSGARHPGAATAYLGGPSLASLADAGLLVERQPGAVAALSRSMRGAVEPAVPPMF